MDTDTIQTELQLKGSNEQLKELKSINCNMLHPKETKTVETLDQFNIKTEIETDTESVNGVNIPICEVTIKEEYQDTFYDIPNDESNRRIFNCNQCQFKSFYKSNLKKHLLRHYDAKDFKCDQCEFKTIQKASLKRHTLTHSDIKEFKCDLCDYETIRKDCLKLHSLKHLGENLQCGFCSYKTIRKSNLKTHLRRHTNNKSYQCLECGLKTAYKSALKKHMRKH